MANFFDQFDAAPPGNFFDQFDQPAPAATPQQPTPAPQQQLAANTMADSQARGLPPLEMPNALGIMRPAPVKAPPTAQQWQEVKGALGSMAKGAPIGLAQGTPGIAGDVESFGRALLSPLGVDRENKFFPTGTRLGEMAAGPPANQIEADTRNLFSLLSPSAYAKALGGLGRGAGYLAKTAAPARAEGFNTLFQSARTPTAETKGAATAFLDSLRGGGKNAEDVVTMAKDGLRQMRVERSAAYKSEIAATIGNPKPLDIAPIGKSIDDAYDMVTYKGRVKDEEGKAILDVIKTKYDEWKLGPSSDYHTAEGLDEFKQEIGNLVYKKDFNAAKGTPAGVVVDKVYNSIKDQIVKQDATYGKVMKDYMAASDEIREIEKSLSLGQKMTKDGALRKLQSVFRNNANTNYGNRVSSAERLGEYDPKMMPSLAGQELSSWFPRGLSGPLVQMGGIGASIANPALAIPALKTLAATSPRLGGELAAGTGYAAGTVARGADALKNAVLPGGGAGIPSIAGMDPRLLAMMSPQLLAQLLAAQSTARQ